MQTVFNPIDYCFAWTDDDWYEWDSESAHKHARKARDAQAKALKAEGYQVAKFTLRNQLVSRGGIGSGHPHIELNCTCYGVEI